MLPPPVFMHTKEIRSGLFSKFVHNEIQLLRSKKQRPCAGTGAERPPHHPCSVRQQHSHGLRSQTFLVPEALSGINYFRHNSNTFL